MSNELWTSKSLNSLEISIHLSYFSFTSNTYIFLPKVPKDSLITQVISLVLWMNLLGLNCVLRFFWSLKSDDASLACMRFLSEVSFTLSNQSNKMFLISNQNQCTHHKFFYTRGTQATLPSTHNTLNGSKQTLQHSSHVNNL